MDSASVWKSSWGWVVGMVVQYCECTCGQWMIHSNLAAMGNFMSMSYILLWKLLSRVPLFATPWTVQSMEFSRLEYWSREPFPSPGDLPNPGIEPRSPTLQVDSLPAELRGKTKGTGVASLSLLQRIFPTQNSNQRLLHFITMYTYGIPIHRASLMTLWVKNLPAMQETQETWVQSLGWEDPLEEEMVTHSSILA